VKYEEVEPLSQAMLDFVPATCPSCGLSGTVQSFQRMESMEGVKLKAVVRHEDIDCIMVSELKPWLELETSPLP